MPRVKRPVLDRQTPIRSWASAMDAEAGSARAPASPPRDRAAENDPVVRGVVSGNRVVEDWIRQAQHAARLIGGGTGSAGWADASGRMLKTTSDAISAWSAMLGIAMPNGSGNGGRPSPDGATTGTSVPGTAVSSGHTRRDPSTAAHTTTPSRITLEITSRRQVAVTVDLHKVSTSTLRVLDLRPERGNARRIRGMELTSTPADGLRLRVVVPDSQAPGTYHAVVLDDVADCAIGTITLRIL